MEGRGHGHSERQSHCLTMALSTYKTEAAIVWRPGWAADPTGLASDEPLAAASEVAQGTVAAVGRADFVIFHSSLEALRFVLCAAFH